MKKLLLLLFLFPCYAFAQIIPPVNDSTAIGTPGAAFTPTFRVVTYGGKTLVQYRIGTSAKWMTLSTTQYNRNYVSGIGSFATKIDSLKSAVNKWYNVNQYYSNSRKTSLTLDGGNINFFSGLTNYKGSIGYDSVSNSVYFQFPFNSPIKMNNRVSGNAAINNDEFITKEQLLDSLGIVAGNSIHNQDTTTQTANFKINGAGAASAFVAGDYAGGNYKLLNTAGLTTKDGNNVFNATTAGITYNNSSYGVFIAPASIDDITTNSILNYPINKSGTFALVEDIPASTSFANRDTVRKYYASSIFKPVLLDSTLTLDVYGNSFEVGADVSTNEAWRYIFKNTFGFPTLIPNASGGTGILYAQRRQMINSPQTNNNRFKTLNVWFNQIGQQGRGIKTLNMGIYGLRAFIANSLLATAVPASDASITKTGVWASYGGSDSSAMKATYIGGTSQQSFTPGATITATTTGNTLVIGTGITDGSNLIIDSLTAVVDGTYTKKFNGNGLINYAPQLASGVPTNTFLNYYHQATVLVFDNLGPGSHTVVITKGGNSSARIVIDYIGTMMAPSTATPLIIGECPYFTPTGISTYNGLYGTQFTNGTVDTANIATIGVVKEFEAYPISIARVNTHFNLTTDVVSDQIHPNPLGHKHIFNAYAQATVPFNKSLSKYTNNVGFITSTPTGTGTNYYGTLNINKDVSQGTGTNRYLILTKVNLGGSLVGNIIGKRTKASSAGTNSANIYVNIRQNATTSTAYWESEAGTNATQPVLVTVTYDDGTGADTWYAIDAITTSTTSSLEKAIFVGQSDTGVPFTWVPAASVTALGTFQSNAPKNYGGWFAIGSNGIVTTTTPASNINTNQIITGAWANTFYTPVARTITPTSPLTGGGSLGANRTIGLAGLTGLGTANQILGMNNAATAYEYKTVTAGNGVSVANGAGTITLSADTAVMVSKAFAGKYITAATPTIVGTPTIAAGAGAGTTPTISVTSNTKGLQVTLTVGTLPTGANATVATITLANALPYTPYPVYSFANATSALLSGATMVYMTSSDASNVTITSGTTALPAGTYIWNIKL